MNARTTDGFIGNVPLWSVGLLRKYAVASLVCALIAVFLFIVTYRQVAIQGIADLGQQNNVSNARKILRESGTELSDYLRRSANFNAEQARSAVLPALLAAAIADKMNDHDVGRVKIYNAQGLVVFSTMREKIGRNQSDNIAFRAAMLGEMATELVYRDTFNRFDQETEEDNLVQTYLPVRTAPNDPPHGVLELYTDVNNLVHQAERSEFRILAAGAIFLPMLWVALLLFVRRTTQVIKWQQQTIRERNATLATLSAHMLETEEAGRKRLAIELNEGLAQTLSAIKVELENASRRPANDRRVANDSVVPLLQRTIGEVRAIATALRPSSLDDLGLRSAISALSRDVGKLHPDLEIQEQIAATEEEIPTPLKIVIYRCLETALHGIVRLRQATRVQVGLRAEGGAIALLIEHDGRPVEKSSPETDAAGTRSSVISMNPLRERVVLSGGELFVEQNPYGATTVRAQWRL